MKPEVVLGDIVKFTFNDAWRDCYFLVIDIQYSEWSHLKTCTTLNLQTLEEKIFYYDDLSLI